MVEYGETTKTVLSRLQETDVWTDEIFNDTEYAMELDRRNVILEGVLNRFRYLGIEVDSSDISAVIGELNSRYVSMGISDGIPKAVSNWLKDSVPANPSYRENLYNLCFALDMSLQEVEEFFLKYYMTIPFNYKDPIDSTYYYCLRMNKTYLETRKLLDSIDAVMEDSFSADDMTNAVHIDLDEIHDDNLFLDYLKNHSFSKNKQFQTARAEIDRLVDINASIAKREFILRDELDDENIHHKITKIDGKVNYKELLRIIYGFDNQSYYHDENKGMQRLAKCRFLPDRFKKSFPRDQEFSNIKVGRASAEVYRKSLVVMKFYNYFGERLLSFLKLNKGKTLYDFRERTILECKDDFDEFMEETSSCLAKCGFVALYPRNPFDWMILYCAHSNDPLDCFREVLSERLLQDDV